MTIYFGKFPYIVAVMSILCGIQNTESAPSMNTNNSQKLELRSQWVSQNSQLGIKLVLQLSKQKYHTADSVVGEVLTINESSKPIRVYMPGVRASIVRVIETNAKGQPPPHPLPLPFGRQSKGDQTDWVTLQPNESFGLQFQANRFPIGHIVVSAFYQESPTAENYSIIVKSPQMAIEP